MFTPRDPQAWTKRQAQAQANKGRGAQLFAMPLVNNE